MWEFNIEVECPKCGHEEYECVEFSEGTFDDGGGNSNLMEVFCNSCDKTFWFKGRISFDISVEEVFKKKPKVKP